MKNLSIDEIYNDKKTELNKYLSLDFNFAKDSFLSPDITDLIVWNLIIAFVVSLSANATYPFLTQSLSEYGKLTRLDLAKSEAELSAKVMLTIEGNLDSAKRQIITVLEEYNFPSESKERIAVDIIQMLSNRK